MKVFLAGIIQGSIAEAGIHRQDYRARIKEILRRHLPGSDVYCPIENHPNSLVYDNDKAREVFTDHVRMAAESDLLLAYIPEASMGTAVEMWETWRAGRPIVAISPLTENWVVKLLSTRLVRTLDEFETLASSGELARIVSESRRGRRR